MNTKRDIESGQSRRPSQLNTITLIFIILFTAACYFLVRSMVLHHFLGGGRDYILSRH